MNDFNNIRINVVYNEILVYDQNGLKLHPNSNINKYDIHPWHTTDVYRINNIEEKFNIKFPYYLQNDDTNELRSVLSLLNSQSFETILDNYYHNFIIRTLDEIYSTDEEFIYPIVLYNNDLFSKYGTINLDKRLVECVRNKKGKICFLQATEGFFGEKLDNIIWVSNLSKKYSFSKEDVIVITSNLLAEEKYENLRLKNIIPDNITIYPYVYFQHKLWFYGNSNLNFAVKENLRKTFNKGLENNKQNRKKFHFLTFNRVPKPHRMAIFGESMCNEKLKGKSIISMGGMDNGNPMEFYYSMVRFLNDDYRYGKEKILNYYKNYDSTKHHIYDEPDLENNKASVFNKTAHGNSFVNIVTESLINSNSIFFSEKTYKPILACQPFVIFGSPHSLTKLKDLGFKTFSKWWDESYDGEVNCTRRLEKIIDIMEEIASWDMEKCFRVTNEMEEVLIHNFNKMIDNEETHKLYSFLNESNKDVTTDISTNIEENIIRNKIKRRLI